MRLSSCAKGEIFQNSRAHASMNEANLADMNEGIGGWIFLSQFQNNKSKASEKESSRTSTSILKYHGSLRTNSTLPLLKLILESYSKTSPRDGRFFVRMSSE